MITYFYILECIDNQGHMLLQEGVANLKIPITDLEGLTMLKEAILKDRYDYPRLTAGNFRALSRL